MLLTMHVCVYAKLSRRLSVCVLFLFLATLGLGQYIRWAKKSKPLLVSPKNYKVIKLYSIRGDVLVSDSVLCTFNF